MYNLGNNGPLGRRNQFGSRYQYQEIPYGYQGVQSSSLIGKVMGLLSFSFIFATVGAFVGLFMGLAPGASLVVAIGGLVVLIALNFLIQRPGINLFLLYLFTFLEGLALAPLIGFYLATDTGGMILGEAFMITAVTSLLLSAYAWTTKRDFSHLRDYLFFGVILLLVAGLVTLFFQNTFFVFLISVVGIGIFSAYVLYYVQRAKYMADTLPNAIGLTVSLFITVLNLFLYILQLLSILQGGRNRR